MHRSKILFLVLDLETKEMNNPEGILVSAFDLYFVFLHKKNIIYLQIKNDIVIGTKTRGESNNCMKT